jgi:hypothetical protein
MKPFFSGVFFIQEILSEIPTPLYWNVTVVMMDFKSKVNRRSLMFLGKLRNHSVLGIIMQ